MIQTVFGTRGGVRYPHIVWFHSFNALSVNVRKSSPNILSPSRCRQCNGRTLNNSSESVHEYSMIPSACGGEQIRSLLQWDHPENSKYHICGSFTEKS